MYMKNDGLYVYINKVIEISIDVSAKTSIC